MTVVPIHRTSSARALPCIDTPDPAALSDAELLAILVESRRGRPSIPSARRLLRDGLLPLVRTAIDGGNLPHHVTRRLRAAVELTRRAHAAFPDPAAGAVDVEVLGRALAARTAFAVQEHLGIVLLDSRDRVVGERELFVGTLTGAAVSVVPIFRAALTFDAAGFILPPQPPLRRAVAIRGGRAVHRASHRCSAARRPRVPRPPRARGGTFLVLPRARLPLKATASAADRAPALKERTHP